MHIEKIELEGCVVLTTSPHGDARETREELGWLPPVTLQGGLENSVDWYLENTERWQDLLSRSEAQTFMALE